MLHNIPDDITLVIISKLECKSIEIFSKVSREINNIYHDNLKNILELYINKKFNGLIVSDYDLSTLQYMNKVSHKKLTPHYRYNIFIDNNGYINYSIDMLNYNVFTNISNIIKIISNNNYLLLLTISGDVYQTFDFSVVKRIFPGNIIDIAIHYNFFYLLDNRGQIYIYENNIADECRVSRKLISVEYYIQITSGFALTKDNRVIMISYDKHYTDMGVNDIIQISSYDIHYVLLLDKYGKVYGYNGNVLPIKNLENIVSIYRYQEYSYAIRYDGTIYKWNSQDINPIPIILQNVNNLYEIINNGDNTIFLTNYGLKYI